MPHVFVESNWLFAYAAPAHHKDPAAVELLERARKGEFTIHMPNICISEARNAILSKCQPRKEADAIRRYLSWSRPAGHVSADDAAIVSGILEKYERRVKSDLDNLDNVLRGLVQESNVRIFGLDDQMFDLGTRLALDGIAFQPCDHAILTAVLVSASKLWATGERGISFCERDADLQPWDKYGNVKHPLMAAYDRSHVWVYGDFLLSAPARRPGFD